jgi:class 3 adenylate cyclase/tetratricopeptide (TPR) repeat protein
MALYPGSAWYLNATGLYADLRNFSLLSTAFAQVPDGAEQLHAILANFFAVMVQTITAHGGDVVAIAGDALTVWWPDRVDLAHGERCGQAMLAAVADLPAVETPAGPAWLDLRIGVAAGPGVAALVGLPAYGVHMTLFGPALEAAAAAKDQASTGKMHIVTSDDVFPLDCAVRSLSGERHDQRTGPISPGQLEEGSSHSVQLTLEHFLPPAFAARLQSGVLLAEYRRCIPAFAAFRLPPTAAALHDLVAQVQTVVVRWGGWLNEVEIGDKGPLFVMLFGAPIAYGDDALRAVGCCLELRERNLITRAGISIGTLFVGAVGCAMRRAYTVQGSEMNLAAHLMEAATPGAVLISGRMRHEVAGHYAIGSPSFLCVKGIAQPVPVMPVTKMPQSGRLSDRPFQRYPPDGLPLIGRMHERTLLWQAMAQAIAGQAQVVILEGEAGIGKSSLLDAVLLRWCGRRLPAYRGICWQSRQAEPGHAWQAMLAEVCGLNPVLPLSLQRRRLTPILKTLSPGWQGRIPLDQDQVMHLLARLSGLPGSDAAAAYDHLGGIPATDDDEIAAMLDLAEALLRQRMLQAPLLLLLEDLQWADEVSLQLAARLAAGAAHSAQHAYPLLLLCSHRPLNGPLPAALQSLHNLPYCRHIVLGALTRQEQHALLCMLLEAHDLSPALSHLIEEQTQGQPLLIKEYVHMLRERRLIYIDNDVARLKDNAADVHLSTTVQGITQARMDRLEEPLQVTLKAAAVIGHTVPITLLRAIHPSGLALSELQAQLDRLMALDILDLELDGSVRVYRFKSRTIQKVAYTSLLFQQRRILHAAVARWYEMVYQDDLRTKRVAAVMYGLLAYHYGAAGDTPKQLAYCRIAALHAVGRYAHSTAQTYLATALALTDEPLPRYDLLVIRLLLDTRSGDRSAQESAIRTLAALAGGLNDYLRQAYATWCRLHDALATGEYAGLSEQISQVYRQLQRAARRTRSAAARRQAWLLWTASQDVVGWALAGRGDVPGAQSSHNRAFMRYRWYMAHRQRRMVRSPRGRGRSIRATGAQRPLTTAQLDPRLLLARCFNGRGQVYRLRGQPALARQYHQWALGLAQERDDWSGEAAALILLCQVDDAERNYVQATRHAERALMISLATGERMLQALALRQLTRSKIALGAYAEARRCAMQALSISTSIGARFLDSDILNDLADLALAQGDTATAQVIREEAGRIDHQLVREG